MALHCDRIKTDCYFLGVHIRLLTRYKICFTLGLFANYFSLKSLSLSLKSHMNVPQRPVLFLADNPQKIGNTLGAIYFACSFISSVLLVRNSAISSSVCRERKVKAHPSQRPKRPKLIPISLA